MEGVMTITITIAAQKGGVGKTTCIQHLGYEMARLNANVLLIDLDTQGNLTKIIAGDMYQQGIHNGAIDCLINKTPISPANVIETKYEGLYLLPNEKKGESGMRKNPEGSLQSEGLSGYTRLKELISAPYCQQFDFILIDNGPNLGLLTVNSLLGSDYVIIPSKTDEFSIDGIIDTHDTIVRAQDMNPKLKILGIFQSVRDGRTKRINRRIDAKLNEISKEFNINILSTKIKIKSDFLSLPGLQKTIFEVSPECESSTGYRKLTKEILQLIQKDKTSEVSNDNLEARA